MINEWAERLKALQAPLPKDVIQLRQDGRPYARGPKFFARFVTFIEAPFVQQRFEEQFLGAWSLAHELLPERGDEDGVPEVAMKAIITLRLSDSLVIIREGIGSGKTFKEASTDSFKRAGIKYGIGLELYTYGPITIEMDGDGKYARPVRDPALVLAEKLAERAEKLTRDEAPPPPPRPRSIRQQVADAFPDPYGYEPPGSAPPQRLAAPAPLPVPASIVDAPDCPICQGPMWDNRKTKTGRQPDFKCKTKTCDGALWLESMKKAKRAVSSASADEFPDALRDGPDDLPF